jgi:flavin-dependent dehydrogenase
METCDVLIVGGGPAGSSCARRLAAAGLDVLVTDRAAFPRDKPCAGWVTPGTLETLGVDPAEYAHAGTVQAFTGFVTGRIGGPAVETSYGRAVSYGIRRCELDHFLLARSGARVRTGAAVARFARAGGDWIVDDQVRTPLLVGAGGHFCPVARALNGPAPKRSLVVAQEVEFRLSPRQSDDCRVRPEAPELYFCPDLRGYGWCVRKGTYLNVGLGRRDPERLADHVRDFVSFLEERRRVPADLPRRWLGHPYQVYERTSRRVVDDGLLLVGDAAGLAAAASGEGIRPAIESGLLAAEAILAAGGRYRRPELEPYRTALESRLGRRQRRTGVPAALARAISAPLLASPWVARHLILDRWFLQRHRPVLRPEGRFARPGKEEGHASHEAQELPG